MSGSTKEELLLRALTTTSEANAIYEDLSDLITWITPDDVPMFKRLARGKARQSLHEWTERSLNTSFSSALYNGESALPGNTANTLTLRNNKVTQLAVEAVATEFLAAMDTIGDGRGLSSFAIEMEEKMKNLLRAIEYYIWNGDISQTSPQQMDGIVQLSGDGFQSVANAGSAEKLNQIKLDEAISKCYEAGGNPKIIACRPLVAQRIAKFNEGQVQYPVGGAAGGMGEGTFRYLSPFGYNLDVVPVRGDFMSSGTVYILDPAHIKLCFMGPSEIMIKDLPISGDDVARKLLKSYVTLELRALTHHARVTAVTDALS